MQHTCRDVTRCEDINQNKTCLRGIVDNPNADAHAVWWLCSHHPVNALQHPNCAADMWWKLATLYPLEAEASVLFPLLTLEDPSRWVRQECENISGWIEEAKKLLSESQLEEHKAAVKHWYVSHVPTPGSWLEYKRYQWRKALFILASAP